MSALDANSRFPDEPGAPRGERILRAARKIAFLQPQRTEHRLDDRNVFGLAAMGSARKCKLFIAPALLIEPTTLEERHRLKRFRAGSPESNQTGVACRTEQSVISVDYRRVHPVETLYCIASGGYNIDLMEFRHTLKIL